MVLPLKSFERIKNPFISQFFLLKDGNVERRQDEERRPGAEGGDEDGDEAGVEGDVVGDLVLQSELTPAGVCPLRVLLRRSNTTAGLPRHPLYLSSPVISLTEVADDDDPVNCEDGEDNVPHIGLGHLV